MPGELDLSQTIDNEERDPVAAPPSVERPSDDVEAVVVAVVAVVANADANGKNLDLETEDDLDYVSVYTQDEEDNLVPDDNGGCRLSAYDLQVMNDMEGPFHDPAELSRVVVGLSLN